MHSRSLPENAHERLLERSVMEIHSSGKATYNTSKSHRETCSTARGMKELWFRGKKLCRHMFLIIGKMDLLIGHDPLMQLNRG